MIKSTKQNRMGSESEDSSSHEDSRKGNRSKARDEDYGKGIKIKNLNAIKDMKNSSKNCIASRLRRRTDNTERKINFDREDNKMAKTSNQNNHHYEASGGSVYNNPKKRELKLINKYNEDSKNHNREETKQLDYSKREKYFNRGNSIYKEYDEFLKKRKKDRKVEFIKNTLEPGEEIIKTKDNKIIQKLFGGSSTDQDTFCY